MIDQKKPQTLHLFGGVSADPFSHHGRPQTLTLSPESGQITLENYCEEKPSDDYILRMPHVLELEASENEANILNKGQRLVKLCSRMHQNISSKAGSEYVFKLGDGRIVTMAGSSSALTFRNNFYYRLAEVFRNLDWLYQNDRKQFDLAEYRVFERCYSELEKNPGQIPLDLRAAYTSMEQRLAAGAQSS
ncbi:MAG TPA: hypothetical protein VIH89_04895 [Candidatus Sulfotelmatobacter sp.]